MAAKIEPTETQETEVERGWFSPDLAQPATADDASSAQLPGQALPGMSDAEWQRIVETLQVLERELGHEVDPKRRAQLCWEVGRIYEVRLGDDRRAVQAYQRAHRADPHHLPSLRAGRAIFTRAARWPMVLRLIDAELRAVPNVDARAALLVEKGEIYARLSEPMNAATCFEAALELDPTCRAAARALVRWASSRGEPALLADALERLAGLSATAVMRARALLDAACVLQAVDPRSPHAVELLEQAHALDPRDAEIAGRLARAFQRAGDWERLIALTSEQPERLEHAADQAARLTETARLLSERVGDLGRAEAFIEQALRTDPFFAPALELAASIAERQGQPAAAVGALQRLTQVTADVAVRVRVLMQMAQLQLTALGDDTGAIASLGRVLGVAPAWWPARELLGRAFTRRGMWDELVKLYEQEVELAADDPRTRADRLYRLGELLEARLKNDGRAETYYRTAVGIAPDVSHFVEAWLRVVRRLGQPEALAAALRHTAQVADTPSAKVRRLEELAHVLESELGQLDASKSAWTEVAALAPSHREARHHLQRLCAATAAHSETLRWLDAELPDATDQARVLALLVACADVCSTHLGDRDAARAYLERALELDPSHVPALRASGRLYHAMGAFAQLVEMTRREAEVASSPEDAAGVWMRVGALCREELADFDAAAKAWERAAALAAEPLPAIRALQTLYADIGDVEHEAEMLAAEAERLTDPREKVALWCRLGATWLYRADHPEHAIDAWQQALSVDPCAEAALQPLLTLYEERGRADDIAAMWRRCAEAAADDTIAARAWVEYARVCADALSLTVEAIDACERALVLADGREAVAPLMLLERLYRPQEASVSLARVHSALADLTYDPIGQRLHLEAAAELLDEAGEPPEAILQAWRRVLEVEPAHARALARLEERLPSGEARLEVHTRRIAASKDAREVLGALLARAELLRGLGRPDEAVEDLERAVALDTGSVSATRALREALTEAGRGDEALRTTEREARATRAPEAAAALFLTVAKVREVRLSDAAGAFDAAKFALEREPTNDEAAEAVQRLGDRLGRFAEVAHALEQRAVAAPTRAVDTLLEVSRIYAHRLSAPDLAVRALNQALATGAGDERVILQRLADLYVESEDWNEAVVIYQRLRASVQDADLRRAVAFRLASIFEDKLGDLSRARDTLQMLQSERPTDADVQIRLARLAESAGDLEAAIEHSRAAVGLMPDDDLSTELRVRMGRLLEQRGRVDEAVEVYKRVLASAPDRADVALRAAELLGRRGDTNAVLATLGATLDTMRAGASPDAARLRRRAAELFATHDPVRAVRELEALVADDPDDSDARQALVTAFVGRDAYAEALPHLKWLVARDPFTADRVGHLRRALSRVGEHERAAWVATWLEALEGAAADDVEAFTRLPEYPRYPVTLRLAAGRAQALSELPRDSFEALVVTWVRALPRVFAAPPTLPSREEGLPAVEQLARRCGVALGVDDVRVLVDRTLGDGVRYADGSPALLVFGTAAVSGLTPQEQAFHIVRGLWLGARQLAVVTSWPASTLETMLRTAAALPRPGTPPRVLEEPLRTHVAQLESLLDKRGRELVSDSFDALDRHLATTDITGAVEGWLFAASLEAMRLAGPRAAWSVLARTMSTQVRALPVADRWRATPGVRALARWIVETPTFGVEGAPSAFP